MSEMSAERQAGVVLTADVEDYKQNIQSASAETRSLGEEIDKLGQKLSKIAKVAGGSLVGIAAADVAVIGGATRAYAQYEEQLSSLQAQAAVTNRSFEQMSNSVDRLRRAFPTTTADAGQLVSQLQRMRDGTENVNKLADTFMKLGGATGESIGGLTSSLLNFQRVMGAPQRDTDRLANVLATLGNKSQVGATGIAEFANQLAPISKAAGMSAEQVLGVSHAFTSVGQDGYRAASAFNQMLYDITLSVQTGSPELNKYANLIGVTGERFRKMNASEYMPRIFEEINRMGPQAIDTLNRMGIDGIRAVQAIQSVAQGGGLREAMEQAGMAYSQPGQKNLEKGAAAAYGGIIDETKKFRNNLSQLAESIGQVFAPVAEVFMKVVNTIMRGATALANSPLGQLATEIAGVFAPIIGGAGALLLAAPALLKMAGIFQILRGSHTQGFRDARSGYAMGSNIATRQPMVMGTGTREMTRTGQSYAQLRAFQRLGYNVGMYAGGMAPAHDPNRPPGPGFASRVAAIPFRLGTGALNLGSGFMSPLFPSAINNMANRETLLQPRTFGDYRPGRAPWFDSERARQYYAGQEYRAARETGEGRWAALRAAGTSMWSGGGTYLAAAQATARERLAGTPLLAMSPRQQFDAMKEWGKNLGKNNDLLNTRNKAEERARQVQSAVRGMTDPNAAGNQRLQAMASYAMLTGKGPAPTPDADAAAKDMAAGTKQASTGAVGLGQALRNTGRAFLRFDGSLAKSTAGLARLAAGTAAGAAGSMARGAVGGIAGMAAGLGPLGWTMIAAMALPALHGALKGRGEKNLDLTAASGGSLTEGYTGALKTATGETLNFANALKQAENSLPTPRTVREAMQMSVEEVAIAMRPGRELTNPAMRGFSAAEAGRQLAPMWTELLKNPAALQAAQMDLTSQFGPQGARRALGIARRGSGGVYMPGEGLQETFGQDENRRESMFRTIGSLVKTSYDMTRMTSGEMKANADQRRSLTSTLEAMADSPVWDRNVSIPGEFAFGDMWAPAETKQQLEMLRSAYFPEVPKSEFGFQKNSPNAIEMEAVIELVNSGRMGQALKKLTQMLEEAGYEIAALRFMTPEERREYRQEQRRKRREGPPTPEPEQPSSYGQAGGIPTPGETTTPKPKPPPTAAQQLMAQGQRIIGNIPQEIRDQYMLEYGYIPGADFFGGPEQRQRRPLPLAGMMATAQPIQQQLQGRMEDPEAIWQATHRGESMLESMGTRRGTRQALEYMGRIGSDTDKRYQQMQQILSFREQQRGLEMLDAGRVEQAQEARSQWMAYARPTEAMRADRNFMPQYIEQQAQFEQSKEGQRQFYAGIVHAFREFDVQRERAEEDFGIQRERMQYQFNLSQQRALADFNLSRKRGEEDYQLSRERALQDYNLARNNAEEDFKRSRERAVEDFNRQERRGSADFYRGRRRQESDFNRQRRRQEADYQHQVQLMIEQTARSAQDIYSRIQIKPTWSGEGLLQNMEEQLQQFEEQAVNLRTVRRLGLSNEAIQALNLADPQMAQQLERMVLDMQNDPQMAERFNRATRRRLRAVGKLVRDEGNSQWEEMERSHRLSLRRGGADFERAMDRGLRDFNRVMRQQRGDFRRSMDRQAEDFEISMDRMADQFDISMDRMADDYEKATGRMNEDFRKTTRRAREDFALQLKQMRIDFRKQMDRAEEDLNRMAVGVEGTFEEIMDEAIGRLSGGARQMAKDVRTAFREVRGDTTTIAESHMRKLHRIYGLKYEERGGNQDVATGSGRIPEGGTNSSSGGSPGSMPGDGKGRAQGGVLPGYTPGRDVHAFESPTGGKLYLSGGEAVMRPEFTKAVGGEEGVKRLNLAARSGALEGLKFFLGGVIPLPGGAMTNKHGIPYGSTGATYAGDFNAGSGYDDYGKPVVAWRGGRISGRNYVGNESYGRWVTINHAGGQSSLYAHLSRFGRFAKGDEVKPGDVIGFVGDLGNTGETPTSHLHFEIRGGHIEGDDVAGGGYTKATGTAMNLRQLPGMRDRYPDMENRVRDIPLFGHLGLGRDAHSKLLNRLYRRRAARMATRRGLPTTRGGAAALGVDIGDFQLPSSPGVAANVKLGQQMAAARGWTGEQWSALRELWMGESGWRTEADNPDSSAYGIPQALVKLPGRRMPRGYYDPERSSGEGKYFQGRGGDPRVQIGWGLNYIAQSYGSPRRALAMWQSRSPHWYGDGQIFNGPQNVNVGERGPEMLLPLNDRGVQFLETLMRRVNPGIEARGTQVRGSIPAGTVNHYNYRVDSSTNFTGAITVQAQDPSEMARKLEQRKRLAALSQPVLNRSS